MADEGVYLFCFCRPGATRELQNAECRLPIADFNLQSAICNLQSCWPGAAQVEERTVGSVAAVCCRVPLADFTGPQAEERFRDPVWVVQRAFAHGRVIETVKTRSPVLPLHFGTVFTGHEALVELLSRHHEIIARFLDEMVDMDEWAVQVFIDIRQAEDWLLASDPELALRRAEQRKLPGSDGPGTGYFREKQLRSAARNRIKQLGTRLAEQLREQIRATGLPTVFLPPRTGTPSPLAGEGGGEGKPGQEMIFHAVCLIPGNQLDPVLARIKEIGDGCREQGATLKTSGPWPPYHFCPALGDPAE